MLSSHARLPALFVAALVSLLLLVPAARTGTGPVSWVSPTPVDQSRFTVKAGSPVSFTLAATTDVVDGIVHIAPAHALPKGAKFDATDALVARGTFTWTPPKPGDYSVQFVASTLGVDGLAPAMSYGIHVKARVVAVTYPLTTKLIDDKTAHWAAVLRKAVVRSAPSPTAHGVSTLDTWTTDGTQNIVLILERRIVSRHSTWYRVRLPILPNNSTGWVESRSLGDVWTVHTHLYVDRAHLRAYLERDGLTVFKTIVGVGRSYWPTPRGEFYIRDKMTGFGNPVYGPIAFGTSARSPVLTDWPGGGFVGVHGTNEPGILPGYVSHGCIRMPNASILKLARLMPVGTPLTVF